MTVNVSIELEYEFEVKAKFADVFELLANVPESATFYPKVDKLVDVGAGVYRWEMEKIGVASINLQTIYASKYVANKAKGTIAWTPVKGVGNAQVSGNWKIKDNKKSTALTLQVQGDLEIPLPQPVELSHPLIYFLPTRFRMLAGKVLEHSLDLVQLGRTELIEWRNGDLVDRKLLNDLSFKAKLAANHQRVPESRSTAQ